MTARSWPWVTTVLVAVQLAAYAVAGTAPDHVVGVGTDGTADRDLPSIGQLTFDVFRHPTTSAMAVTVAFLVPVVIAAERTLDAVAVAATYLVAGFASGMVGLIAADEALPVLGAYGATTGVVAAWAVTRWRLSRDAVLPAAVAVAWVVTNQMVRSTGTPWLPTAVAACVGFYAVGSLTVARSRQRQHSCVEPE